MSDCNDAAISVILEVSTENFARLLRVCGADEKARNYSRNRARKRAAKESSAAIRSQDPSQLSCKLPLRLHPIAYRLAGGRLMSVHLGEQSLVSEHDQETLQKLLESADYRPHLTALEGLPNDDAKCLELNKETSLE
jgi:hypothetical protein